MSNSASASISTSAPSLSPSIPASSNNPSPHPNHASTSASPTLPHSLETARQIAEARAALEASMSNIGSSLDHTLKSRAQTLHANDAALEVQQKQLMKETEKLREETEKLKKVADEGAKRVKELGNVQNWAEMLERDFMVLGETMRLVKKGDKESGWKGEEEGWETSSGSGTWSRSESGGDDTGDRPETGLPRVTEYERAWAEVADEEPSADTFEEPREGLDGEGDTTMEGKGKEPELHTGVARTSFASTTRTGRISGSESALT